jgi:hypothetical protein
MAIAGGALASVSLAASATATAVPWWWLKDG